MRDLLAPVEAGVIEPGVFVAVGDLEGEGPRVIGVEPDPGRLAERTHGEHPGILHDRFGRVGQVHAGHEVVGYGGRLVGVGVVPVGEDRFVGDQGQARKGGGRPLEAPTDEHDFLRGGCRARFGVRDRHGGVIEQFPVFPLAQPGVVGGVEHHRLHLGVTSQGHQVDHRLAPFGVVAVLGGQRDAGGVIIRQAARMQELVQHADVGDFAGVDQHDEGVARDGEPRRRAAQNGVQVAGGHDADDQVDVARLVLGQVVEVILDAARIHIPARGDLVGAGRIYDRGRKDPLHPLHQLGDLRRGDTAGEQAGPRRGDRGLRRDGHELEIEGAVQRWGGCQQDREIRGTHDLFVLVRLRLVIFEDGLDLVEIRTRGRGIWEIDPVTPFQDFDWCPGVGVLDRLGGEFLKHIPLGVLDAHDQVARPLLVGFIGRGQFGQIDLGREVSGILIDPAARKIGHLGLVLCHADLGVERHAEVFLVRARPELDGGNALVVGGLGRAAVK